MRLTWFRDYAQSLRGKCTLWDKESISVCLKFKTELNMMDQRCE